MIVRFPSGLIGHFHGGIEETKYQIWITKSVHKKNQIFLYNNEIYNQSIHPVHSDLILDLAILIYDKLVLCHPQISKSLENLGYSCLNSPDSFVDSRTLKAIDYTPRFYNVNDVYYKDESLKKNNISKANEFYEPYNLAKNKRLEDIKTLCEGYNSDQYVITTFNEPYIILFQNFIASCEKNNIAIREKLIVFPMDWPAKNACDKLEVKSYFKENAFGPTTSKHQAYGDHDFKICMFIKNAIIQDMLLLGKEFLYQDIDMVWLQNPLEDLKQEAKRYAYDFLFMFDGGNPRFQPLYYNSGFVYLRNTDFTRRTWDVIFQNYDKVWHYRSQQIPVNIVVNAFKERGLRTALLNEHEYLNGHLITPDNKNIGNIDSRTKVVHVSWTGDLAHKIKKLKENRLWFLNN